MTFPPPDPDMGYQPKGCIMMAKTILEYNDRNEPIWFAKLVDVLKGRMDRAQAS
jgi:hypothetical protein